MSGEALQAIPGIHGILGFLGALSLICLGVDIFARPWRQTGDLSRPDVGWMTYLALAWFGYSSAIIVMLGVVELTALVMDPRSLPAIAIHAAAMQFALLAFCKGIIARHPAGVAFQKSINGAAIGGSGLLPGLFFLLAALPLVSVSHYVWTWLLDLLANLTGAEPPEPQPMVELLLDTPGFGPAKMALMAVAGLLAPWAEECFFRGVLYRAGKQVFSARGAVVLSAALFALAHINLYAFGPLFVLGVMLARAYECTGRLAVPIVMHAAFNLTNLAVIAVESA
ncbi:MAG: lysostaphin resistance A-like protein [Opitutales bacterium]